MSVPTGEGVSALRSSASLGVGTSGVVREWVVPRRALFARLSGASRVTVVSVPAGGGKTCLLRSWIADAGLADSVGWVSVEREEHDPQRFWIAVHDALQSTQPGSAAVRAMTPAPSLDAGAIVERLLEDLDALEKPLWLVIDDLHELRSDTALRELTLFLMRAPAGLRFVLSTRQDLPLELHRLRLEGDLTELRADDLRFSLAEARALFEAVHVRLPESALTLLHDRTEGWCAGLRLAALSLVGHPDPERFAAEFSGSERTVADYLLAEVLERQPDDVKRMLLRTSILERVNGPLADLLTGCSEAERVLLELEESGAFVVALDAARTWFRYHHLFADLLQLELRRTAPAELSKMHHAAAGWFAEHRYAVEAVRHAQAAEDWSLAARLLFDDWFALDAAGQGATARRLLAGFPRDVIAADPELSVLAADQEPLEAADQRLEHATRQLASVPAQRRVALQASLAVHRLRHALRRSDLPVAVEEAQRLMAPPEGPDAAELGAADDIRSLALAYLGIAEIWSERLDDACGHLEQARALAHQAGRPYVEMGCLAHLSIPLMFRSFTRARQMSARAIALAQENGWTEDAMVAMAHGVLAAILVWQMHLDEAQHELDLAQRAARPELDPATGLMLLQIRGKVEMGRGRDHEALALFRAAARLDDRLAAPHAYAPFVRAYMWQSMLRLGQTAHVEEALSEIDDERREWAQTRIVTAALRLAQDDPQAAATALAPVLDGSEPLLHRANMVEALLLEAIARDALGDAGATRRALEGALDTAEPDGVLWPFAVHPAPELLERHSQLHTAHSSLVAEIRAMLAGTRSASRPETAEPLREPLSESETRVLRYLPTNLSAPEIADELYVAASTVKTHIKHIYAKLGTHCRAEAVERARTAGLLAPASLKRR
jgi:LuxR family maltose regulon positive regulatory protein